MEETFTIPLEIRVRNYKARLHMLGLTDKRRFIDITHNAQGRMCRVYHNFRTNKPEYEPIERKKY